MSECSRVLDACPIRVEIGRANHDPGCLEVPMNTGKIIGLFILSGLVVALILLGGPFIVFVDTRFLVFVVGVTISAAFVSVPGERLMACLGPDLMKAGGLRSKVAREGGRL